MSEKKGSPKTDAMRKMREERVEEAKKEAREKTLATFPHGGGLLGGTARLLAVQHAESEAADAVMKDGPAAPTTRPTKSASKGGSPDSSAPDETRCTGCGKIRAVRNGKVTAHQKGFGKQCPGAGKAPA